MSMHAELPGLRETRPCLRQVGHDPHPYRHHGVDYACPGVIRNRYADACRAATTRQGLDPVVDRLTERGITHTVEQTGGFTMVVTVPAGGGTFGITRDGVDPHPYLLCFYDGKDWQDGEPEQEHWADITLDDVVDIILLAEEAEQ